MVDLRLLGPVQVRLDGEPIELGPRKQRAVLAMLALRAGRTVSVDALIEGLWGEEPPASAAKMVQLYISHLRAALNGDGARIVTHGRGYELQLSDGEVDAMRFERLLEDSRAREALGLWRGTRSRTSPPSRSPPQRSGSSTSGGCTPRRWRSTATSRRAGTPR